MEKTGTGEIGYNTQAGGILRKRPVRKGLRGQIFEVQTSNPQKTSKFKAHSLILRLGI